MTTCLLGCDKDDISLSDNLRLESYYAYYMDYDPSIDPLFGPGGAFPQVQLEYSKNKLVKKKGDFLSGPGNYGYIFFEDIVDELSYSKNKIIIEKKSYNPLIDRLYTRLRTIDLSNDGLMMKKTILELGASGNFSDKDTVTIQYTYNSNKKLTETYLTKKISSSSIGSYIRYYENSLYYYNQNNNLDSIVTIRHSYNGNGYNSSYYPSRKVVEFFSNYDNASNPTKNLFMFDETFKRSLSKNNYASYKNSIYYYSNDGVLNSVPGSESGKTWTYAYDEEGNIRLGL
jgi:hypothetical protein